MSIVPSLIVAVALAGGIEAAHPWGSGPASPHVGSQDLTPYEAAVHVSGKIGARPASGKGERRAHGYVAGRFRAAGLEVT
jgi:hypothetical protein